MLQPCLASREIDIDMQNKNKICISGIGIVSPLGQRVSENWEALKSDKQASSAQIRGFNPSEYVKRRYLRPLDAVTIHCIAMTGAAMDDAGVGIDDLDPERVGIVVGSMFAGIGCIFDFKQTCYQGKENDYLGLSPLYFPGIVFNSLSGQPAIEYGFTGPNSVFNSGFASGLLAVIKGIEYIQTGKADVVIAGGAEMCHPFIQKKFSIQKEDPAVALLGPDFQPVEAVCLFVLHRENDKHFANSIKYGTVEGWHYGFLSMGYSENSLTSSIASIVTNQTCDVGAVVMDSYDESPLSHYEKSAIRAIFDGRNPMEIGNKNNFGHALGASGSLNLFHGLLFARDQKIAPRAILVNSIDPGGNYAFLTLRPEIDYG